MNSGLSNKLLATKQVEDELLTKKEVAKRRKQSTRTVDRDVKDGRFPAGIKLGEGKGGAVRWPKSVVEKWIADRMVG